MIETISARFQRALPGGIDFCSLRYASERSEFLVVRDDVLQPVSLGEDSGAMLTVVHGGGLGYAATSDLSEEGIKAAIKQAQAWAERSAGRSVIDFEKIPPSHPQGTYTGPCEQAWDSTSLSDKIALLQGLSKELKISDKIVTWAASLGVVWNDTFTLTNGGGRLEQSFTYIFPQLRAVANEGAETQKRTFGANAFCQQGGLEVLETLGFKEAPGRIAREALELLEAPNCPTGKMDLLLGPDQMILQIHESIGHPIELDRILGDERNYAGTSFVTLDMFGEFQYGSELLNVSFDPTRPEQMASYGFDDEGAPATKEFVIKEGKLLRPLGGTTSQKRADIVGTANSRACSWNRPPIDRMANLNVEPGESSFDDLVKGIERGVFMETNTSWSIDDSRNKFQFGCEIGRVIEDGELKGIVKKPNYRGVSRDFWRNLKGVGDESTFKVMGTPNCGKGEPNQVIRVGHASPTCLFGDIEVFGGV